VCLTPKVFPFPTTPFLHFQLLQEHAHRRGTVVCSFGCPPEEEEKGLAPFSTFGHMVVLVDGGTAFADSVAAMQALRDRRGTACWS